MDSVNFEDFPVKDTHSKRTHGIFFSLTVGLYNKHLFSYKGNFIAK